MNKDNHQENHAPIPLKVVCRGAIYRGLARPLVPQDHIGPACKYDIHIDDAGIQARLFHDGVDHWKIKHLEDEDMCRQIIEQVSKWYRQPMNAD